STTSRVIPASIAFVGDVVANLAKSVGRAASTALAEAGAPTKKYKGGEITGPLEGVGKEAVGAAEALAPLVSGDPEKVRKAVEEEVGYAFVPLVPRGAVSRPAKAVKEGVKRGAKAAARGAVRVFPKRARQAFAEREMRARRRGPGRVRRRVQIVTGGAKRKRVSV